MVKLLVLSTVWEIQTIKYLKSATSIDDKQKKTYENHYEIKIFRYISHLDSNLSALLRLPSKCQ